MLVARSELNYYPEPEIQLEERKDSRKKTNRGKKSKKKVNSSIKLTYIFIAIIFLGTSLFILSRYAEITLIRMDITNLEKEKMELEKIKTNLVADLEGIKSSSQIAEDAKLKLGMGHPTEGQVVYLTVKNNEANDMEEENIQGRIKKISNMLASLF